MNLTETGRKAPPSPALQQVSERWAQHLPTPQLRAMAPACLRNTLETTTYWLDDDLTYVITGDIPAMWLRDSSAQVETYLRWVGQDEVIRRTVRGLIHMQARMIVEDPYANAFNPAPTGREQFTSDRTDMKSPWMFERKYEVDSLCYPVRLLWRYLQATGDHSVATPEVRAALHTIRYVWRTEQRHFERSDYFFDRPDPWVKWDTLSHGGHGSPVAYTGMTWSGFRPSDDACTYGYLIPSQMFAVVALGYMAQLYEVLWEDKASADEARALRAEINEGIRKHGVINHPEFGPMYAYEVDGLGNCLLMDDANVPSLLSAPYLGYCPPDDPLYLNTRRFVLSRANPYYVEGQAARGVGSPHTPPGMVWHLGMIMQGLTARDRAEQEAMLQMCAATDAGTGFMHEGLDPDDPARFTRPWFAWSNTLFAELVLRLYGDK